MKSTVLLPLLLLAALVAVARTQKFSCPAKNGQFADSNSCFIFWQCDNGIAHRLRCPTGSLYDGFKHKCISRDLNVTCGPQVATEAPIVEPDPFEAPPCDPVSCQLPLCHCDEDGTAIPGGFRPEEIPQMIMITLDGAVNHLNYDVYNDLLLDNRTSPNGCPIRATFFVTHDYTNYQMVEEYYSKGNEISVGSITRRVGLQDMDHDTWVGEMVSMREILRNFASVRKEDIKGMRAPHLKPGRNQQYEVLADYGWSWDSSISVPPGTAPVWPYSLDYKIPHECRSETCPTRSFPGIWELPLNSHFKDNTFTGGFCPYLDQCVLIYLSKEEVTDWLIADFERHYLHNKAPYILSLTTNWFQSPELVHGLNGFLEYTQTLDDVYFVTMSEALEWLVDPVTLNQLNNYGPWDCRKKNYHIPTCTKEEAGSCGLTLTDATQGELGPIASSRYMVTCKGCPNVYPWTWDAAGLGIGQDSYQPDYPNDRSDASSQPVVEDVAALRGAPL
ncbi:chitin deacetylase Cda4 [Oratosquilla oratoria]|uniref:chitin deacetylase Cda4 n=1 Tax=Oratosquilla oratoria TaxID=337810 RepID=UPI003F76550A